MATTYNQDPQFLPWLTPMTAELTERLLIAEQAGANRMPTGSFVQKCIKGKQYWYVQWSECGRQRQQYFGPDSEAEAARRATLQSLWHAAMLQTHSRAELCQLLRAGQLLPAPAAPSSRLLVALHATGLHRSGAVLIGTFAFMAYQGLFGLKWPAQVGETQDIDIASEPHVWLIVPENLQLWPLLQRHGLAPIAPPDQMTATSFASARADMRVDVIAPLRGRPSSAPLQLPNLGLAGVPLRFIDHLIDDPVLVSVPLADGVLVVVPQPARFALHKLLVAPYRRSEDKRRKDLRQAEFLLELLVEAEPMAIHAAYSSLPLAGWRRKVIQAFQGLRPQLAGALTELVEHG